MVEGSEGVAGRRARRVRAARAVLGAAVAGLSLLAVRPAAAAARDDAPPADKSRYTLFLPTPPEQMREMAADRPDVTESPYTVDAGHVQVEMSFAEWGKGGGSESLSVLPVNVKLGLTNFADVQFVVAPYNRQRAGGRTDEGAADAQVRLKLNLWGNDGGPTALAVMPFVSFPTGADAFTADGAEGGVIVPLLIELPAEFSLTVMAEVDFVRDGTGGRDTLFVHTASLGRTIAGPLGGYVEYVGVAPVDGGGDYEAYGDVGFTYGLSDDVQLDAGVNVGLNAAAEDLRVFTGLTFRL